jgi:endonuclease/exonuclease/phosphatase family metal-dependent hydrolase
MTLRIVTFNIQHGRADDGVVDPARLARAVAALEPDVLALQEVDVRLRRSGRVDEAQLAADAAGLSGMFGRARRVGWRGQYGNALLARDGLAQVEVLRMPRPAAGERRSAVLARARVGSLEVSVAATHLAVEANEARRQLDLLLDALGRRPLPRLLLGDLNLTSDLVAPAVEAAGMTLVRGPATFPADAPRIRIDHVAVAGLDVVSVAVPESDVSDHRPLVVEVERA